MGVVRRTTIVGPGKQMTRPSRFPVRLLTRTSVALVLLWLPMMGWLLYWCRSAIFQEPGPLPISLALYRFSQHPGASVEPVSSGENRWVQRAGRLESDGIERMLSARGWHRLDQMGSMRVFSRSDGAKLRLDCHMYTIHYQICKSDRIP